MQVCNVTPTALQFPDGCWPAYWSFNVGALLGEGICPDPQLPPIEGWTRGPFSPPLAGDTYSCRSLGYVYNEAPREDANGKRLEEGHLVIIWPRWLEVFPGLPPHPSELYDQVGGYVTLQPTHVSVKVRKADLGVDSIAEVPDFLPGEDGYVQPGQPSDIALTLFGTTGAQKGHPLIANPTFCSPQSLDAEFLGYAHNSRQNPAGIYQPGFGDGKTVTDSVGVQATNCAAVPYAPTFTAGVDSEAPGATAALSTVITQKDDEATSKKVQVEFPKGMGVNINSSLTPCSAADLAAKSCPESSKMGTVEAESRLLPKREFLGDSVKPEDEVLVGNAYLTGLEGDKLSLSLLLTGFIDLELKAKAGVDANGTLTATFDDLPTLPYNKFTLNLFGGEKSLLQNPRRCGTHTTKATFTSHSGKTHTVETTSQVKGCNEPTFDAELSEPGKGKRTGLELEVRSDQKPIKEVKFGIDRHMLLTARGLGKKRKFGEVSATSAAGTQEAALKRPVGVSQKKKKAFSLRASALEGLGVNIYRKRFTRQGVKTIKRKSNREKKALKKKTVPKNRMSVKNLPGDDLTKVTVSINPDQTKLLRNLTGRKTCHARFIALIKTEDGTKYALKQKLRLRGKGCGKKSTKKSYSVK